MTEETMNKKHILFFICFLLLTAAVCILNYTTVNKKESTVNSQYSNENQSIFKESKSTIVKQNNSHSNPEGKISMTPRRDTYPVTIWGVYVTIENNTPYEYNTGLGYTIEYLNGSAWDKVPLSFVINYPVVLLHPGGSGEFAINLYHNQYNYKPGTYRVLKTVESSPNDTQILFCEFNLE